MGSNFSEVKSWLARIVVAAIAKCRVFFFSPSLPFRKKFCGRGKEEMGGEGLRVPALLVLIAALPVLETRSRYCRRAYYLCSCPEQR